MNMYPYATELVDGGIATLPDGRTLRLVISDDDDYTIHDDGDWYGQIVHVSKCRQDHIHGYYRRPDSFDGAARKMYVNRTIYWWQPPADVKDPAMIRTLCDSVRDTLIYGYQNVGVELCEGNDAYGHPIVVADWFHMGIEWHKLVDTDKASVVADVIAGIDTLAVPE